MYIPHELSPHQERYCDVFAMQLKLVRTVADMFPEIVPPPEPPDPPAGVREPRRPHPKFPGEMTLKILVEVT